DVIDEIVMIEVECRAALNRRQPFGADAEERARAEAGVVEIETDIRSGGPSVGPPIASAAADHVRVDAFTALLELVAAEGEVDRGALRRPLLGHEIGALAGEVVRVGGVADAYVSGRGRPHVPNQIEFLPRRHVAAVERQRAVLLVRRGVVPAVPAVN